jgi:CelD/BcsL family acetyltransferase involved in cellulose biosynthesis
MLVEKLSEASWTVEQANTNVCPYIPLNGCSWDDYLASLGSEHRYGFQRKMKKLAKEAGPNPGDLCFGRAENEAQREEALRVLIELHEKRWRDRGEASDAFHTPEHVAFHNDFTKLALCAGWLRLYLLRVAGRPLSAFYGFRYGRKFYFFQSGFDPGYARLSLGLVTMGMAIRTAIEEGAAEYDLLHGAEEYKFHWASQTHDLFRIQLFPAGFRGLLLQHAVGVTRSARRLAKQVLRKG